MGLVPAGSGPILTPSKGWMALPVAFPIEKMISGRVERTCGEGSLSVAGASVEGEITGLVVAVQLIAVIRKVDIAR